MKFSGFHLFDVKEVLYENYRSVWYKGTVILPSAYNTLSLLK
jgi:hypothetical protein